MKHLKLTSFLLSFAFLASCFGPGVPQSPVKQPNKSRTDAEYDKRKDEDKNRSSVLSRSRKRLSGNTCEKELERDKNHDCEEQCGDIYSRRADREDCEELTVRQIEILVDIHEALEDPG